MKMIALTAAVLASTLTLSAAPQAASAATVHHRHYQGCERWRHRKANQGTATGAVAGGVLGNVLAGSGNRTGGTIIGAGVGAVVGHQIASKNHRCH